MSNHSYKGEPADTSFNAYFFAAAAASLANFGIITTMGALEIR